MSVLNKTPYLNQLIATLSDEEKATLTSLINGSSAFVFRSLVDANNLLTSDDNLTAVALQLDNNLPALNGWFVNGAFLHFSNKSDELKIIKIDLDHSTFEPIDEYYTATDLRQILGGMSESQVQEIIVDDKNILSQLEFDYDEDTDVTIITFPENVLPLTYYNSELEVQFTFDYESTAVYDDNGDVYEGGVITFRGKSVILVLEGVNLSGGSLSDDVITYCFFNNFEYYLNTHNMYFPITGFRTMYWHHIMIYEGSSIQRGYIDFFSPRSTYYTKNEIAELLYDNNYKQEWTAIILQGYNVNAGNNSDSLTTQFTLWATSKTSLTSQKRNFKFSIENGAVKVTTDFSTISVTVVADTVIEI